MRRSRVLVVDDEATIRRFLVRVLEHAGYEVRAATNGREALQLLAEMPFDLLLTDIRMDEMDGVGLLQQAKKRQPDLAVILLTGHASVSTAVEALRQGAHDYLLKPVRNEDVVEAVGRGLEARFRQQRRDRLEQVAGEFADILASADKTDTRSNAENAAAVWGDLVVDPRTHVATLRNRELELTPTQFRVLLELTRARGAVLDYVHLVSVACGYTCSRLEAREIMGTHVRNLRKKIAVGPGSAYYVEVVRGVGYRLVSPDRRASDV